MNNTNYIILLLEVIFIAWQIKVAYTSSNYFYDFLNDKG